MKKTKLLVRIRGEDREDFYLDLVVGSSIELVAPNHSVLGSVRCLSDSVIATKMSGDEGWTIQGDKRDKIIKGVVLGTPEADDFIKEEDLEV